jgi:hypothetical protein
MRESDGVTESNVKRRSRIVGCAAVMALIGCAGAGDRPRDAVRLELRLPPGSGEPNLFATPDGSVLLSWFEPADTGHALKAALRSRDGVWSPPVTVVEGRDFFVNWADFPSVVVRDDGSWVAHWLEKLDDGTYAYHVKLAASADRGASWSEPVTVHTDRSSTEHGFVSLLPLRDGGTAMVWLDGRNTGGGDGHGGAMQLRGNILTRENILAEEQLVDSRICDCCQTALVATASGLVAAYRDRSEEEIRDIAVRRFSGGAWSDPVHVGPDDWKIPGCPVNGPALAASGDTVAVVWFTGSDDTPKVTMAFSFDGGRTFGDGIAIDDGAPLGRVDAVMLADGSVLAVWMERTGEEGAHIRARRAHPSGEAEDSWVLASTSHLRQAGFPRIVRTGSELILAWTVVGDEGGVRAASMELE